MLVYLAHAMFAAFLVCLIYAVNKQGENQELLLRGLEEARRADAEAARYRLAMAMEAQQEATDKLRQLIEGHHVPKTYSPAAVRERGSAQVAQGHEAKKSGL